MSENTNPEGGTPSPYGPPSPYGAPSPYGSQSPYGAPNSYGGNAAPQPSPAPRPAPTPYYNPSGYPPAPQNWNDVPEAAKNKATISLVLGIVSFAFLGLFLSIPGYILGKQAEAMGAPNGKVAKIINLINIAIGVALILIFIFLFGLGTVGYHSSRY